MQWQRAPTPAVQRARPASSSSCGSVLAVGAFQRCRPSRLSAPRTASTTANGQTSVSTAASEQPEHQRAAAAAGAVPAAEPSTSASQPGQFAWTKQWYPVAAVENLATDRPNNVKLLGMNFAVWKDANGAWSCLQDKCSHRMAPLSEGRIEDGHLNCCYHGWQFDGEGKCVKIPQMRDEKAHAFACSQPSSRVKAYPSKVEAGLLWVWPESGLEAILESSNTPLRVAFPEDTETDTWNRHYPWFVRDLPLRFDTAAENLMDISHAPHAHHGVPGMGNRYKPLQMVYNRETPIERDTGYVMALKQLDPPFTFKVSFKPPCFIRHAGPSFSNEIFVVPTEPGWCRVFMGNLFKGNVIARMPLPMKLTDAMKKTFPALDHILLKHAIFDGDTYMLHLAERELLKVDNNWRQHFFMPAQDDLPIVTFRRWLQDFGGEVPTLGSLSEMPPAMSKEETMDRYLEHTRFCPHCQQAVSFIDTCTVASWLGAALAAVVVVSKALAGHPLLSPAMFMGAAAAAALCGVAGWLRTVKQQFYFVDYVHAHKH